MTRRILKEALVILLMLSPLAVADFYGGYSGSGFGGSEPIVSLSLDPQENLNNGFRLAARQDRLDELQAYLKSGADLNSTSDDGATALMISARMCSPKLVRFLIESKADANLQDHLGRTALMFASMGDCVPVVDQLLAVPGIKVKLHDRRDRSAADYAGYNFQISDKLHAAVRVHKRKAEN